MWARGGVSRDGTRVPLPWTDGAVLNHGFSMAAPTAEPWLPQPAGWGTHSINLQQHDPESSLSLVTMTLKMRRLLWKYEVFGPNDGGLARGGWEPADLRTQRRLLRRGRRGHRTGAVAGRNPAAQRRAPGRERLTAAEQRRLGAAGLSPSGRRAVQIYFGECGRLCAVSRGKRPPFRRRCPRDQDGKYEGNSSRFADI